MPLTRNSIFTFLIFLNLANEVVNKRNKINNLFFKNTCSIYLPLKSDLNWIEIKTN